MYNEGEKYDIKYVNSKGKEVNKTITPDKNMSKPQMIMKLKEEDKQFFKLLESNLIEASDNTKHKYVFSSICLLRVVYTQQEDLNDEDTDYNYLDVNGYDVADMCNEINHRKTGLEKHCNLEYVKRIDLKFKAGDGHVHLLATVTTSEELNDQQIEKVKDYLTGQYSDGWGEVFEQQEIDQWEDEVDEWDDDYDSFTDIVYLYVSPWFEGDEFHIDLVSKK